VELRPASWGGFLGVDGKAIFVGGQLVRFAASRSENSWESLIASAALSHGLGPLGCGFDGSEGRRYRATPAGRKVQLLRWLVIRLCL